MSADQSERISSFEFLRALGCALVVLEHVFLPASTIEHLHQRWCFSFGGLGIGIFTFVSGYLIARSLDSRSLSEYAASRFWRVFPAYAFVLLMALLIFLVFGYSRLLPTQEATAFGFLAQLFFVRDLFNMYNPLISGDWTLIYEVQFYIVIGFAWAVFRRTRDVRLLIVAFLAVTMVVYLCLIALSFKYAHGQAAMQRTGGTLFCFTGAVYYLASKQMIRRGGLAVVAVWALGAIFISQFRGEVFYEYVQVSFTQLLGISLAVSLLRTGFPSRTHRAVRFLADISFPIYLLHQTFGTIPFSSIAGANWKLSAIADRGLTFFLLVLPASILIHFLVERPCLRMSSAKRERRLSQLAAP